MNIKNVKDLEFKKYGRILKNYDVAPIINQMHELPLPNNVIYEPSVEQLEKLDIFKDLKYREFGGMDIQIGYCNGSNYMLNALEYHRSSEINIAATDLILLVGSESDIKDDFTYDTSNVEAFLVPEGTIIEVYATTLHYAPCNSNNKGFKCVVVLPKDTNLPLEKELEKKDEDQLLFAKNKWLIGHPNTDLKDQGAFIGLVGENISIK